MSTLWGTKKRLLGAFLVFTILTLFVLWPLPEELKRGLSLRSIALTDRNGDLLYDVRSDGLQIPLTRQQIPKYFEQALIATEDRSFYFNLGFSPRGIIRSLVANATNRNKRPQGGSTLTQQYVRIQVKPQERNITWKLYEIWTALRLTTRQSKDSILTGYINHVFFGQNAYGLGAAARIYFNKDVSDLSLGEQALLAGLVNAPTNLNPFQNKPAALQRKHYVLDAMLAMKSISKTEYMQALEEPIELSSGVIPIRAPHFVFWLLANHPEIRTSPEDTVQTTIDLSLQTVAERAIRSHLEELQEERASSAAAVVLDVKSGDILAMVGSGDFFRKEIDGAVNVAVAPRQPGSSIKPFTYALALMSGMTAATTVVDTHTQFLTAEGTPYIPRNYDYGEHGLVRIREALANSYNIPAVKILERIGVEKLMRFLQSAGISTLTQSPEHYGLALTLGDAEVKLLELSEAYGSFARGGKTLSSRALMSLPVYEGRRIMPEGVAWIISDILSDNEARSEQFGRVSALSFDFPVAAKTGTTRNSRDNWVLGYTPDFVVGVWVGNADNTPMRGTSGITGAAPIFREIMQAATKGKSRRFQMPDGIVTREICRLSGMLATPICSEKTTEFFLTGTEPTAADTMIKDIVIDKRNGLLGDRCPTQVQEKRRVTDVPAELRSWAKAQGWSLPPEQASPLCISQSASSKVSEDSFTITRPAHGSEYLLDPLIPDTEEKVIFEAYSLGSASKAIWRVNGKVVGEGQSPDFRFAWKPEPGLHEVTIGSESGSSVSVFRVRK